MKLSSPRILKRIQKVPLTSLPLLSIHFIPRRISLLLRIDSLITPQSAGKHRRGQIQNVPDRGVIPVLGGAVQGSCSNVGWTQDKVNTFLLHECVVLASVFLSFIVECPIVVHAQGDFLAGFEGKVEGMVGQGEGGLAGLGEFVVVDFAAVGKVEGCL